MDSIYDLDDLITNVQLQNFVTYKSRNEMTKRANTQYGRLKSNNNMIQGTLNSTTVGLITKTIALTNCNRRKTMPVGE